MVNLAVFFVLLFFLANNTLKTFSFFYKLDFLFQLISVNVSSCCLPQANLLQNFIHFFNKENTSAETTTKLSFISSIWDDDHIWRLDEKTGNAYGVINVFKESMILRLFLTYWGRRVCTLKVVMLLKKNLT